MLLELLSGCEERAARPPAEAPSGEPSTSEEECVVEEVELLLPEPEV